MKTLLFFAPHPDDEIFGCAEKILRAIERKDDVHIVYVTTGSLLTDKGFVKTRRDAVTKIWTREGILKKKLHFLGFEDPYAYKIPEYVYDEIKKIIDRVKPDEINVPAYEGGHIVHDLVNYLVYAATRGENVHEYAMYNNRTNPVKLCKFLFRETINKLPGNLHYYILGDFIPKGKTITKLHRKDLYEKKLKLIEEYKAAEDAYLKSEKQKHLNKPPVDAYRELPKYEYLAPPHKKRPLKLGYEYAGLKFEDFKKTARLIGDKEDINQFLYEFDLTNAIRVVHPKTHVTFTRANILHDLTNCIATLSPSAVYRTVYNLIRKIRYRDDGFYAMDGLRVVSRCMIAYKGLPDFEFKEGEAAIFACETEPDFRGNRLYPALITLCLQFLQGEDYKRVYMWTDYDNRGSQIGIMRGGFKRTKKRHLY